MDSRFPKETPSLQWVTQRRMASIRSFGGCHSIQLSYERVQSILLQFPHRHQ